jgi:hypothetical protein
MRIIIPLLGLTCALGVPAASAQTLDDAVRLVRPDDIVFITDDDGRTVKGQLVSISPESVRILTPTAVVIPSALISRIDRRGDPIRDGFRNGAIVGAAFGALNAAAMLERKDLILFLPKVWTGAIEFGLLGMLFDWLHTGRTTLYRAPAKSVSIAPLAARGSHGLAVSWRF